MRRLVALAIAAQLLLAQRNAAMPKDAASINAGREIYMGSCSGCHGATGEGSQGSNLLSGRVSRLTDQTLFNTIRNGLPGITMPNFSLPPATVWQIVRLPKMGTDETDIFFRYRERLIFRKVICEKRLSVPSVPIFQPRLRCNLVPSCAKPLRPPQID